REHENNFSSSGAESQHENIVAPVRQSSNAPAALQNNKSERSATNTAPLSARQVQTPTQKQSSDNTNQEHKAKRRRTNNMSWQTNFTEAPEMDWEKQAPADEDEEGSVEELYPEDNDQIG